MVQNKAEVAAGEQSLAELELLTDTAGSEPVESVLLRRERFDAGTFIGKGQLADLVAESKALDIDATAFRSRMKSRRRLETRELSSLRVMPWKDLSGEVIGSL